MGGSAGGLDIDVAYRSGFMMASMGIAYAGQHPPPPSRRRRRRRRPACRRPAAQPLWWNAAPSALSIVVRQGQCAVLRPCLPLAGVG